MNNRNHHNNEPPYDEHPFEGLIERALLHLEDESIDTAQHRPAIPEYRITIEHGSIRIGQECVASPQAMCCQHADCQEMRS
jgi:hypothetical protein